MSKPFSQACENNKAPILDVIRNYFVPGNKVLEIGSYTGQHIRFFAEHLPQVIWQPSEIPDNLPILEAGLDGVNLSNILPPLMLDVSQQPWAVTNAGGIFSANTLHIMSEDHVTEFFRGCGKALASGARLCVYGPFNYAGHYTSDSNARFQDWLKAQNPVSGLRDFESVNALAQEAGMTLLADHSMPANNQLLVWQRAKGTVTL